MEAQGASGAVGDEVRITAEEALKLSSFNSNALIDYAMKKIKEAAKDGYTTVILRHGPWQQGLRLAPESQQAVEMLRELGYEIEVPHIYFPHSAVKISWSNAAAQSQGDKQ